MIHTLELGGRQRKLLFGNYVFRRLEQDRGVGLSDVSGGLEKVSLELITDMVYYALRCAEIATGEQPEPYSAETVAVWMDAQGSSLGEILSMIADSVTSMTKSISGDPDETPGEASKKNRSGSGLK